MGPRLKFVKASALILLLSFFTFVTWLGSFVWTKFRDIARPCHKRGGVGKDEIPGTSVRDSSWCKLIGY